MSRRSTVRLLGAATLILTLGLCAPRQASAQEGEAGPRWQVEPYWRPVAGISSFSSGGSTWVGGRLGATAGVHYWKAPLLGRTRVLGAYTTGTGVSGLELRLGSFMGPHKEYWGAEAGVDLFWDRFTADGYDLLPGSVGIDLPVNLHLGPQEFYGLAGITPAILFAPERRVDWSSTDAFGFGHEFAWQLGLGAHLGRVGAALTYSRRIVATGVYSGWGISLSL